MKKLLFIFLFFSGHYFFAQQNSWTYKWDSLQTYQQKDTIRANILVKTIRYNMIRDFSKNVPLIQELFTIANEQNSRTFLADAYNCSSEYYYAQGDYLQSLDEAIEALKIAEEINYNSCVRTAKLNIGKASIDTKNYNKAYDEFTSILSEKYGKPSLFEKAKVNFWLTDYYLSKKKKDFEKATTSLQKSEDYFKQINSKIGLAFTTSLKARLYKVRYIVHRKESDLALSKKYSISPFEFYEKEGLLSNLAYVYYTQATTKSIAGNHLKSIPFYQKALAIYEDLGELFFNMKIKQHLFVAFSITENQKEAVKVNKRYVALKDSIFGIEKRRLLANAQAKFDTQKLKNEKRLVEIKSKRNRNLLIGFGIIAMLSVLSLFLFYTGFKDKKKVEITNLRLKQAQNRLALEKQYRLSELKALKSQMNPHFIFNALNSIQDYIITNKKDLAGDYLGKFADLIRRYLSQSTQRRITLFEEIETLEIYLELEKLRFAEKLDYQIDVAIENTESIELPTMLIQPYVENALKHGLLHKKDVGKLRVYFYEDEVYLICKIEDNGVGRKRSEEIKKQRSHKSFATQATKQRIALLNHNKTGKITIFTEDLYSEKEDPGTRVVVKIPLNFA